MTDILTKLQQFVILLIASCAMGGSATYAQVAVTRGDDGPFEIIEMTVSAAAEPSPVFKHRLTVLPHETTAGNAATVYMNSLGENALTRKWKQASEAFGEDFYRWARYETPRESIPLDKLRQASGYFDDFIRENIERASLRRDSDWGFGFEDLQGSLVFDLPINGLQETRSISRVLNLQAKLAILEFRFDDAIHLMKMNYRLAENVGREKVLVGSLISFAVVGITNGNMVDLIATPDSPNMYWALTELPRPVADLRGAFRLECRAVMRIFPAFDDVESESHSPEEWARIIGDLSETALSTWGGHELSEAMKFIPAAIGVLAYAPAKKRLIAQGFDEAKVEAMPVGKVLLLDANREYRLIADQVEKEIYLPNPVVVKRRAAIEEMMRKQEVNAFNSFGKTVALIILPAVQAVLEADARTQRDIDALRLIEALRMHAAENGKFPASLEEIALVPVPDNPATGKPFEYRLDGATAVVELPRSDGITYSKRYKITLR